MNFSMRKYSDHLFVSVSDRDMEIDLGMLDAKEAKSLLYELEEAIDTLQWFIQSQDKS